MSNLPRSYLLLVTGLVIFLLALLPRLLALDAFLTTDEKLWWERSRDFFGGLVDPNFTCPAVEENDASVVLPPGQGLACTLRAGHPGVLTMWSGGLGIWLYYLSSSGGQTLSQFIANLGLDPIEAASIFWVRLPTVLIFAAFCALYFLLLARLLAAEAQGYALALLAALFLALSPYAVALSRVLHVDALNTVFVTLALLSAFCYWFLSASRRWLLLSGILTGAALVSKTPALFLLPFMALLGGWYVVKQALNRQSRGTLGRLLRRVLLDGLLWLGTALVVVFLLWPALWLMPWTALLFVLNVNFGYAGRGHEKGNFFLGTVSQDPGPLFYPLNWLLHAAPLVLVGFLLALLLWLFQPGGQSGPPVTWKERLGFTPDNNTAAPLFFFSLVFVLLYALFLTLGPKKQDRYLLPIYPFMHLLSAFGWFWLGRWLRRWRALPLWAGYGLLLGLVLLVNGLLLRASYPYYFTAFNPLLGGLSQTARLTTVGWGEGLDQAAAYLNQKPDADSLKVAAWYGSTFAPYFKGQAADFFQQKGQALGSDYVVVYINQRQRQLPDAAFLDFLESYSAPEKIFALQGVPYVWLYPGLGLDHTLDNARVPEVGALLGWEYTSPGVDRDQPQLKAGETLTFDIWWEYLGLPPQEGFFAWLVGPDQRPWLAAGVATQPQTASPATWPLGAIVPATGAITIPPGMPPGDYALYLGVYPETPARPDHFLFFSLENEPRTITIAPGGSSILAASGGSTGAAEILPTMLPAPLHPSQMQPEPVALDVPLGQLRLLGWQSNNTGLAIDQPFDINLFWQAARDIEERYQANLALLDEAGQTRYAWQKADLVGFYPTDHWQAAELVRSQLSIRPDARTPAGDFSLALQLHTADRLVATVPLRPLTILGRPREFELKQQLIPQTAEFEHGLRLLGYHLAQPPANAGDTISLQLAWQATEPVGEDYTIFVQLLGPDGQLYGQMDAPPLQGSAPTSHWTPGEIVVDTYTFPIAAEAPAGVYKLVTGLYHFETGERLVLSTTGQDFVVLEEIAVQ